MKLKVIGYDKDSLGEMLHVQTAPGWLARLFGAKPRDHLYERWWKRAFWQHGWNRLDQAASKKLDDLRDAWEHDNRIPPTASIVRSIGKDAPTPRAMPSGPAYAPGELFECDCGRQHPAGWVCASALRDQL